jgi:hypothetical protein
MKPFRLEVQTKGNTYREMGIRGIYGDSHLIYFDIFVSKNLECMQPVFEFVKPLLFESEAVLASETVVSIRIYEQF